MSSSTGSVEMLDDTDPRIVYTAGATSWDASKDWGSSGAYQNTLHITQDTGSYATVIFKGVSISVNSLYSSLGANFTATLDDLEHGPINLGTSVNGESQVKEAFRQSNLDGTSQHTLVLWKVKQDPNWTSPLGNVSYFNIDFVSVEGTVISPSGVSITPTATAATSAETGDGKNGTPLGLIIGMAVLGVVLLIAVVIGAPFFVRWRRNKTALKPKVEAYLVGEASSPPQSKSRATPLKSMGGPSPTSSKGAPPLPVQPVVSPSTERIVSATTPIPSKRPLVSSPPLPARETTEPPVPPVPIPQITSIDARLSPPSTPDLSATPYPGRVPPALAMDNLPPTLTAQSSQGIASESNTMVLRSEIDNLREQVRLLQLREATQRRGSEFQPDEPPPQYSPRRPGYRSDDGEDD